MVIVLEIIVTDATTKVLWVSDGGNEENRWVQFHIVIYDMYGFKMIVLKKCLFLTQIVPFKHMQQKAVNDVYYVYLNT